MSRGGGRPTKIQDAVTKLEEVFRLDVSDTVACQYAGISRETYYRWMENNDWFRDKMTVAKNYAYLAAKSVVAQDIINKKSIDTAKWYLEKKHSKEFTSSNKMELTGEDGQPIKAQLEVLAGIGFLPDTKEIINGETTVPRPQEDDAPSGGSPMAGQA